MVPIFVPLRRTLYEVTPADADAVHVRSTWPWVTIPPRAVGDDGTPQEVTGAYVMSSRFDGRPRTARPPRQDAPRSRENVHSSRIAVAEETLITQLPVADARARPTTVTPFSVPTAIDTTNGLSDGPYSAEICFVGSSIRTCGLCASANVPSPLDALNTTS